MLDVQYNGENYLKRALLHEHTYLKRVNVKLCWLQVNPMFIKITFPSLCWIHQWFHFKIRTVGLFCILVNLIMTIFILQDIYFHGRLTRSLDLRYCIRTNFMECRKMPMTIRKLCLKMRFIFDNSLPRISTYNCKIPRENLILNSFALHLYKVCPQKHISCPILNFVRFIIWVQLFMI